MATAITNIIVGSQTIDPYRVSVQQKSDAHHHFEIAVSSEGIEGENSFNIDTSVNYIGESAQISIRCADGHFQFRGLITGAHIDRTYGADNLIILSGYSYSYLLEDGIGTKSYEEKNLATIANEILGAYPTNLLNPTVSPQYSTPIPYVVRYKETNYQFLSRLAATYGEWLYYDGQSMVFGKLPNPESIILTLGRELESFDYGVHMRPSKFKNQFYNYEENRIVEKTSTSFKPGWLDNYGKKALDVADNVFPGEPINPLWDDASTDALIKHLTEVDRGAVLSDTAFFKGKSTQAGIKPGGRIQAKAINTSSGQNVSDSIGNFRITAVTHHLDANNDYHNTFEAIPVTVTAPPMNENVCKPEAEPQVAVVKHNHDPEGLGRVRAQFKWQADGELTPWLRVITSSAAGGRGMYFIPELEDQVYIDFDQSNPDRPYVVGSLFHGDAKPIWGSAGNDNKALTTRSGNSVALSDSDGSVTISDPSGNTITLGGNGEISISAPNKITLSSTDIIIDASNDVMISAGNNIGETASNNYSASAGVNMGMKAGTNLNASAGSKASLKGSSSVSVSGKRASFTGTIMANIQAGAILTVITGGVLNLTGAARSLLNGAKVKVRGGKIELNS